MYRNDKVAPAANCRSAFISMVPLPNITRMVNTEGTLVYNTGNIPAIFTGNGVDPPITICIDGLAPGLSSIS